jgi:hypothetical protein
MLWDAFVRDQIVKTYRVLGTGDHFRAHRPAREPNQYTARSARTNPLRRSLGSAGRVVIANNLRVDNGSES